MLLGTIPVVDAAAADSVTLRLRGRVFGVVMTSGIVVGALSPYVMGLIHDIVGGQKKWHTFSWGFPHWQELQWSSPSLHKGLTPRKTLVVLAWFSTAY
jgi:MFS family permease